MGMYLPNSKRDHAATISRVRRSEDPDAVEVVQLLKRIVR